MRHGAGGRCHRLTTSCPTPFGQRRSAERKEAATVTEERGTYHLHHADPDRDVDGVERVGDILHRLIDKCGWPLPGVTPTNGDRPGTNDAPRRDDA
jgi:LmbE family N-acetylglucosaminyl deacetylase